MTDYEKLKAFGHSPAKAAEILLDVKRGDVYAQTWLKAAQESSQIFADPPPGPDGDALRAALVARAEATRPLPPGLVPGDVVLILGNLAPRRGVLVSPSVEHGTVLVMVDQRYGSIDNGRRLVNIERVVKE